YYYYRQTETASSVNHSRRFRVAFRGSTHHRWYGSLRRRYRTRLLLHALHPNIQTQNEGISSAGIVS
ncbi:hypothetical protein PFISCL1PPCAC_12510, partial [Pristionchus fissidentatus]